MQDILEAVPIDKYFELFKPGEDRERALGGFIRVTLRTGSVNQLQGQIPAGETQPPPHKTAGMTPLHTVRFKTVLWWSQVGVVTSTPGL